MDVPAFRYLGEECRTWSTGNVSLTLTHYPARQRQKRHRHENPTFFFLLKGDFVDESDAGALQPNSFELLYHPAGAWHESRAGDQGRLGINIEPTSDWLSKNELTEKDLGEYRVESDPMRSSELLRLAAQGFDDPEIEAHLLEIIVPSTSNSKAPEWFGKIQAHLSDDPNWTLHGMADEVAVHPVHLARVFRARHGCSFTTYVQRLKLLRAAQALSQGESASSVAHDLGFADQSHLGRLFKAWMKTTPGAFTNLNMFQMFYSAAKARP